MTGLTLLGTALALASAGAPAGNKAADPSLGATLPEEWALRLPFARGAAVEVLAAYGPDGGSRYHVGVARAGRNNNHFALNLAPRRPDAAVHTPLPGTVVRAGPAVGSWVGYGRMVLVRHAASDGHVYTAVYAHLNRVDPELVPGRDVPAGQRLGWVGRSCDGVRRCARLPTLHLHWALYRDCALARGRGRGCAGGVAVRPEPLEGRRDLRRGLTLTSTLPVPAGAFRRRTDP